MINLKINFPGEEQPRFLGEHETLTTKGIA